MDIKNQNFIFFGGDKFSEKTLDTLKERGLVPSLIVTNPDRPSGRGMELKPAVLKVWAENSGTALPVWQPENLDKGFTSRLKNFVAENKVQFFVVSSYGKIMPKEIVEMPEKGTLNIHPSLLPLYRGATPVETVILDDQKETGVTIMLMDEKMDHGPILNQEFLYIDEWKNKLALEAEMAEIGGNLLADTITPWLNNEIEPQNQNHDLTTFTKKITKENGLVELEEVLACDRKLFLKIVALNPWPGVYFFIEKGRGAQNNPSDTEKSTNQIRVKITEAEWNGEKTLIKKVIPEGKKEMTFDDFKKGFLFSAGE